MTADRDIEAGVPAADVVARYLQSNPEFFNEYPELLRELVIPHAPGGTVSLFERQVAALREENERLKKRFEDLVRLAMENEGLNSRIHQLALDLIQAAGPRAIFEMLDKRLREDFDADRVVTLVFGAQAFADGDALPQFCDHRSPCREPFKMLLIDGKPLCGRLSQTQKAALFGDMAVPGSTVVLPLSGRGWEGVLAISSNDASRFDHDMGTDFLAYLGDVVTLVLDPWVVRPTST